MSDTPRTDEMETYYSEIVTGRDHGLYWVKADFARKLERANAGLNSILASANSDVARYAEHAELLDHRIQALLDHCPDAECMECGKIMCQHGEPLHFHHDGCPACDAPSGPTTGTLVDNLDPA